MTKENKLEVNNRKSLRVLMVEDSEDDVLLTIRELKKGGYNPVYERVETAAAMKKALHEKQWDIILCDYKMPKFDAPSAIAVLKDTNIDIPIIIVSGTIGEDVAVGCMRSGAQDYIMKGNLSRLCPAISRELEDAQVRIQRKLAEDALRQSNKKYRIIAENTADQIAILDMNLHFTYISPNIMRLRGLTVDEAMTQTLEQVLTPESMRLGLTVFKEEMQSEVSGKADPDRTRILELEEYKKDGSIIWVEVNFSFVRDNDGKPVEIIMVSRDVTERKQQEEEMHRTNILLNSVIENIPDMIFLKDAKEYRFVRFNRAGEDLLGHSSEELLGKSDYDFFPKEQADLFTKKDREVLRGKEVVDIPEETIQTRNKGERILHTKKVPILNANGEPEYLLGISEDITERKRVEEALRASEELFRNYLEYAPDGVYMNDVKGTFLYGNRKCEEIIGYKREKLIGKNFLELNILPENSLNKVLKLLQENREGKSTGPDELELIGKEGRLIPVEINTSVVQRNGEGIVLAFVRDISDRKRAEESLQKSEANYKQLFDNSPTAIYQVDFRTGKFLKANDIICEYFGCNQKEITSISPYDLLTEESRRLFFDRLNKMAIGDQVPADPEYEFIDKNGKHRWLKLNSKNIYDSEGLAGADVVAHDITERKQAEEELTKSENKYRLLANNVQDVIFVLDMNLKYTYISPSVKTMRGYEPEEVLKQQSFEQILTPSSNDLVMRTFSEIMELEKIQHADTNASRTLELEMRRKDGTTVWTEVKFSFIRDEDQRPVGILGLTRDITERRKAEEELRERDIQLKKLSSWVPGMMYQFMKRPDGTYCVPFTTEAIKEIFGCSPEDVREDFSPVTKIILPEDVDKLVGSIEYSAKHLTIWTCEYRVQIPGQSIKWIFGKSTPEMLADGSIIWYGFNTDITETKKAEEQLHKTLESLRKAVGTTIQVLVSAVESKDPYTAGHQLRVADLACAIATEMGLSQEKIEGIHMAGSIHDIGKLSVPAEILSKPTKLTNNEFSIIKEHAQTGYDLLKDVESSWPLAQIVYQHHERMDGSGYPRKLKGDEILLEARIMAVADVVEAMASHRPYRPGLGIDAALAEIEKNRGTFYDDTVADACLRLFREKKYTLTA